MQLTVRRGSTERSTAGLHAGESTSTYESNICVIFKRAKCAQGKMSCGQEYRAGPNSADSLLSPHLQKNPTCPTVQAATSSNAFSTFMLGFLLKCEKSNAQYLMWCT